jgi:hypothetical protein
MLPRIRSIGSVSLLFQQRVRTGASNLQTGAKSHKKKLGRALF